MTDRKPNVGVELSVRLTDDRFESKVVIPLDATDDERQDLVDAWIGLMDAGVKVGRGNDD